MVRSASLLPAALIFGLLTALLPAVATAQATRTWVSGVGDDANPCSRTAPCKTFAGAISKTQDGGEISVLDPGGYGAVSITKGITIDGTGSMGSILNAGVNGIIVNAPNKRVALKNLTLNGGGTGLTGVRVLAASQLLIDTVSILGSADGIDFAPTGNSSLVIKDSTISVSDEGLKLRPSLGTTFITVDDTTVTGGTTAVFANAGFSVISDSVLSNNSAFGIYAEGVAVVNVEHGQINNNAVGVQAATASSIIRLSDTGFYNNNTALACGPGALVTAGNNRRGASPNVVLPGCNPALTIQIQ